MVLLMSYKNLFNVNFNILKFIKVQFKFIEFIEKLKT